MVIHNTTKEPGQNFELLRQEGIRYIQQLSGDDWTDHNEHDPGITILEQLCYVITDLCYRISYDVPDLLTSTDGDSYQHLHSPATILSTAPVTLADLKKIVLDVPGVENAWIETISLAMGYQREEKKLVLDAQQGEPIEINGLYKVWIDVAHDSTGSVVKQSVEQRLSASRALCEDIYEVKVIEEQPVKIKATIEVGDIENAELFLATIYKVLEDHISPTVTFYSLQQMEQKGYSLEKIMSGPTLINGFTDEDELISLERKKIIFTSDLVRILHQVPELKAIKNIQLISSNQVKDWKLEILPDRAPKLDINFEVYDPGKDITLQKNGIPLVINLKAVQKHFSQLKQRERKTPLRSELKDVILSEKRIRNIEKYYSIQNHFPAVYAIGEGELPDSASALRFAQRNQLKAYLLFFDQILSNYFSQAAHLKDMFSYESSGMYFSQVPFSIPGLSTIIEDVKKYQDKLPLLTENNEQLSTRKNRVLNHLMARYAEDSTHFSLFLPGLNHDSEVADCKSKTEFLKWYPEISSGRGMGIDYNKSELLGGLEKRLKLKLGYSSEDKSKPFHLIEHLLLKPISEDHFQRSAWMHLEEMSDIFSLQVTYIFYDRLKTQEALIHDLLREETPAHINLNIIWMNDVEFKAFDALYRSWRIEMAQWENLYKMRGFRNRIIDTVTPGLTYPMSDVPAAEQSKIVPHDVAGKVIIRYSEVGVVYHLFAVANGVEQKTTVTASGNGKELVIETENLVHDSEFVIYAVKKRIETELRVKLNTTFFFKIGIDKSLKVTLRERNSIIYGQKATVLIEDSQEKVEYKLFDLKGNALSDPAVGVHGALAITTYQLGEDTTVILKASKTFEESDAEVVEITRLSIPVLPNLLIGITLESTIVSFKGKARVIIEKSQKSVVYQLYYKSFDENDILYEPDSFPGNWHLHYTSEPSVERDLYISGAIQDDFSKTSAPAQGTGRDLIIETEELTTDLILMVKASKQRPNKTDELILDTKLVALVMPRIDLKWESPNPLPKNTSAEIVITNPQRGVVYQLMNIKDQQLASLPVVFHKNKNIEQARLGIDMVIDNYDEEVVTLDTDVLATAASYILKATQLYTGVSVVLDKKTIKIDVSE